MRTIALILARPLLAVLHFLVVRYADCVSHLPYYNPPLDRKIESWKIVVPARRREIMVTWLYG